MKLKKLLLVCLCACTFALCGLFAPLSASAETEPSSVETSTETSIDETESTKELTNEEKMQAILEFVGEIAEEAGVGDKWQETIAQLKTAVDEKKIDIMTVINLLTLLCLASYGVYKVVRNRIKAKLEKNMPANVEAIKTDVGAQTNAVNGLIDEQNKVNSNIEKNNDALLTIAHAAKLQNQALREFIAGTQLTTETKESARRALRESDEAYDKIKGGV